MWSSAWKKNVNLLCDFIFGERRRELVFEWDQAHCVCVDPHPDPRKKGRSLFRKDLKYVWEMFTDYGPHNTLIIDDCRFKMSENPSVQCAVAARMENGRNR